VDLLRRPFGLPDRRLRDLVATTLLQVVLVLLMGGAELGVVPGFPALVLPARLEAVVAKGREPRTPALSPFLLLSTFPLNGGCE
jgi:hypothetical protein